jgi:dTDP-4-amino-4,6-dideoxygalactose transaminase
MNIPFLDFKPMHHPLKESMMQAFEEVYDSNWFIQGQRLAAFEQHYAAFNQVKYAVGTSNGLDALHIALRVLDIKNGDEVIVPSNTFIASALAVSYIGAKPVLVEPHRNYYTLDIEKLREAITPKTKVIMPVHLFGQAADMSSIMAIAKEFNLYVVEDNAQAQGATFDGMLTGSQGHINATSFYPGKNLGALGDAGALTTNTEEWAASARRIRNYGSSKKYYHDEIGFNMRMDECQAAFLSVKLKCLREWNSQRQQIASWYNEALSEIEEITLPQVQPKATHVYHVFAIRCALRDALQAFLQEEGIGTLIHYPVPIHLQPAYRELKHQAGDFPIAEELANTSLSLPIWPGMTPNMVGHIADTIKLFFTNRK